MPHDEAFVFCSELCHLGPVLSRDLPLLVEEAMGSFSLIQSSSSSTSRRNCCSLSASSSFWRRVVMGSCPSHTTNHTVNIRGWQAPQKSISKTLGSIYFFSFQCLKDHRIYINKLEEWEVKRIIFCAEFQKTFNTPIWISCQPTQRPNVKR